MIEIQQLDQPIGLQRVAVAPRPKPGGGKSAVQRQAGSSQSHRFRPVPTHVLSPTRPSLHPRWVSRIISFGTDVPCGVGLGETA